MRVREKTLTILFILSLAVNVFFFSAILIPGADLSPIPEGSREPCPPPGATFAPSFQVVAVENGSTASMQAPIILRVVEVDRGSSFFRKEVIEEGAMVDVSVEVVPGRGRVLVQTMPLTGILFQDAANLAVAAAVNQSRVDLTGTDVIFSVRGPEGISEIDGPSAGALMAVLLVSVLEDFALNESVTVTGTIDADGGIGPVGGIIEKAEAAGAGGKVLLVLPAGNNRVTEFREEIQVIGGLKIARQRPVAMDTKEYIEERFDIGVEYAGTLDDLIAGIRAFPPAPTARVS